MIVSGATYVFSMERKRKVSSLSEWIAVNVEKNESSCNTSQSITFSAITKAHTVAQTWMLCNYVFWLWLCRANIILCLHKIMYAVCVCTVHTSMRDTRLPCHYTHSFNSLLCYFSSHFLCVSVSTVQKTVLQFAWCSHIVAGNRVCVCVVSMASGTVFVLICFSFTLPSTFECVFENVLHWKRLNDRNTWCVCVSLRLPVCVFKHSLCPYLKHTRHFCACMLLLFMMHRIETSKRATIPHMYTQPIALHTHKWHVVLRRTNFVCLK